jgi:putative transposase
MKGRHHTPEQVVRKLAESEKLLAQGKSIEEVCQHLEITESTWHRWRHQYGGMKLDDVKRLKELERENTRPKKIVAAQALDIDMLKVTTFQSVVGTLAHSRSHQGFETWCNSQTHAASF